MATQLQIRRGTSTQVAAFTGAEGEIVVNTTNDSVHVNDGSTAGGFEMARADLNNVSDTSLNAALTGNTVSALTITTLTADALTVDTNTLVVDATNNRVGIGTSSPSTKLTVFGTGVGNATVQIEGEGGADPFINFLANNTQHWSLGVDDSDADKFKLSEHSALGTNDYFVVDVTGNVGIGMSPTTNSISKSISLVNGGSIFGYGASTYITGNSNYNGAWNTVATGPDSRILLDGNVVFSRSSSASAGSQGTVSESARITSDGNLLVGKTTADNTTAGTTIYGAVARGAASFVRDAGNTLVLNRLTSDGEILAFRKDGTTVGSIGTKGGDMWIGTGDTGVYFASASDAFLPYNTTTNALRTDGQISLGDSSRRYKDLYLSGDIAHKDAADNARLLYDKSSNLLGNVGTNGTFANLLANGAGDGGRQLKVEGTGTNGLMRFSNSTAQEYSIGLNSSSFIIFDDTANSYRMVVDASGNLLVGTTDSQPFNNTSGTGFAVAHDGYFSVTRNGTVAYFNRNTSDGDIVDFRKDGTTVGSIGAFTSGTSAVFFGSLDTALIANSGNDSIHPWNASTNSNRDNAIDFGNASNRWDDIYATNGTIQTSDRNEKQDIEALSDAEQRVAVAAKGLLRKFRWISSVEENGDDARIHFGIIAQDLQAAFTAEGLDAGRYAMFTSNTWTDEDTGEERSRMGVRYSELLAFIISAI